MYYGRKYLAISDSDSAQSFTGLQFKILRTISSSPARRIEEVVEWSGCLRVVQEHINYDACEMERRYLLSIELGLWAMN